MIIGIPKEIKNNENRVSMVPAGVFSLVEAGHSVLVEKGAGFNSGYADEDYSNAGAEVIESPDQVWNQAEMIVKVKEPLPSEFDYFREGLVLLTYLHLAANPELASALKERGVIAIASESIKEKGAYPLLTPMSEIAGKMAPQIGAQLLEKTKGGMGLLLGGVPGVSPGKVTIIGGGIVGTNAAKIAVGLGADVTLLDVNADRLRYLDDIFGNKIRTLMSNPYNIAQAVSEADLVIGSVLIPGAKAPILVSEKMIASMKDGSVVIDVAIDQGGIIETCDQITTHDDPTYTKHGVIHYAVPNMPGAVPRTSTVALTNLIVPYVLLIANKGVEQAILNHDSIKQGLNVSRGNITNKAVARDLRYEYVPVEEVFKITV